MNRLIRDLVPLAALAFLAGTASAETKTFTNVNTNALDLACLNAGGTFIPGTTPNGTGCKTKLVEVKCDTQGTCTCTGQCTPARVAGPAGRGVDGLLNELAGIQPVNGRNPRASQLGAAPERGALAPPDTGAMAEPGNVRMRMAPRNAR